MNPEMAERVASALDSIANALERQNRLMVALVIRGGSPHTFEADALLRAVNELELVL